MMMLSVHPPGEEGGEDAHEEGDPDTGSEEGRDVPAPLVRSEEPPPSALEADGYNSLPVAFS